ncbi:aromatic acid/H+ symport family MFS transporter, partial [Sphingomonas sp. C8-2]
DQIGRKRLLLLCLLAVSASCFVTIFVNSVLALAICRLVTGMFASAVIANMVALASELAPARRRSTMVTMVLAGSMPGAILGSAMQAFLLNQHGWHIAFWIGAGLPLLLLPVMLFSSRKARNSWPPAILPIHACCALWRRWRRGRERSSSPRRRPARPRAAAWRWCASCSRRASPCRRSCCGWPSSARSASSARRCGRRRCSTT